MGKYIYQKFLLNCDYEDVQISDFPHYEESIENVLDYRCDYCLFDLGKAVVRKLSVAEIDEQIDSEENWTFLLHTLRGLDVLVLYDYDIDSANPIISSYREATLKAYLYRFKENNINIYLA